MDDINNVKIRIDMTGWKMTEHNVPNSKITVIKRINDYINKKGQHYSQWLCECSCDNHTRFSALGCNIRSGSVLSCGCMRKGVNKKYNQYNLTGAYGIGYTTKGEEFWFDLEDYDKIKDYCWYYNDYGYLLAHDPITNKRIRLHRLIMNVNNNKLDVNHKKHPPRTAHKIDNRKSNLEIVTRSQNNMNSALSINNNSGVTGVTWDSQQQKWRAKITKDYKRIELGMFKNFDEAVKARKDAEKQYFGEYRYDINN